MFQPTHLLVSRSRQTPVQLIASERGFKAITEIEFQQDRESAFEIRSKQGFFCQGIPVVGYGLQPISLELETSRDLSENASVSA